MRPDEDGAKDDSVLRAVLTSFAEGLGVGPDAAARLSREAAASSLRAEDLTAALLSFAAECGALEHQCVYLSTPITTGRNHIDRIIAQASAAQPLRQVDRSEVIAINKRRAQAVAAQIRSDGSEIVIDPTSLIDVPGWEQYDYHRLWTATIEVFAKSIVFVDGWQYSVGCTTEFHAAVRLGLPTMNQRLEALSHHDGLRLLQAAVDEVGTAPDSGPLLTREVNSIRQLMADPNTLDVTGTGVGQS